MVRTPLPLVAPLLAALPWLACTTPEPDTTAQVIRWACAPDKTRSDQRFEIRLAGGCVDRPDDYRCEATKESDSVTITLWGPRPCNGCACTTVNKPCSIPPLPAGTWRLAFTEGEALSRDVQVGPGHPVFRCAEGTDGGVTTDGSVSGGG